MSIDQTPKRFSLQVFTSPSADAGEKVLQNDNALQGRPRGVRMFPFWKRLRRTRF
jgi:hypothetical protein